MRYKNQQLYDKTVICDACVPPCHFQNKPICPSQSINCRICLNGTELGFFCDEKKHGIFLTTHKNCVKSYNKTHK